MADSSDYEDDNWRDRGLGLDPSPSLPNAPRTYERGPVPQQPYVPKPPFLPSAPPPPGQQPYYEPQRDEQYGREHQEQNPFRPQQQPPATPPAQGRPSPFGPGSNGAPARPPAGNGTPPRPSSNGNASWSGPAPQPNPFAPAPPGSNGHGGNGSNGVSGNGLSGNGVSSNGLPPQQPPRPPQRLQPPDTPRAQQEEPQRRYEPGPGPEPVWGHERRPEPPQQQRPPEPSRLSDAAQAYGAGRSQEGARPDESRRREAEQRYEPQPDEARRSEREQRYEPQAGEARQYEPQAQADSAPQYEPQPQADSARRYEAQPQEVEETTQPQEIRLRSEGKPRDNGYLTDPSAEYEINAPVTEDPSGEQSPATEASRPIGARRRADVQQDAPSQVPAEQLTSHRAARRAFAPRAETPPTTPPKPTATANSTAGEAEVSPYGGPAAKSSQPAEATGNQAKRPRRYRVHHLRDFKNRGEKWAMLTAYDQYTAEIFDQAGIPVLLVGDSAANNVYGYDTTLRVTVDELIPLARAVANAAEHALVVADLPFGSYQASPEQAFHTAVRFMKEAGVQAVKLEGGRTVVPMVEKLTQSGIPVMAHIGFTPQSEHSIGGYRVQGRGDQAAGLIDDAVALAAAGAFSVVLEMVPGDVAAEITKRIPIPTIGIGAGRDTDAQVLVWQDMAGLRSGTMPRFVKQYADLRGILTSAATTYAAEVANGAFPAEEHTF